VPWCGWCTAVSSSSSSSDSKSNYVQKRSAPAADVGDAEYYWQPVDRQSVMSQVDADKRAPSFRLGKRYDNYGDVLDNLVRRAPTFRLGKRFDDKRAPSFRLGKRAPSFRLGWSAIVAHWLLRFTPTNVVAWRLQTLTTSADTMYVCRYTELQRICLIMSMCKPIKEVNGSFTLFDTTYTFMDMDYINSDISFQFLVFLVFF